MHQLNLLLLLGLVAFAYADVLLGPNSGNQDDAISSVTCPAGQKILTCKCLIDDHCDGGVVTDDGLTCKVYNTYGKPGVQAAATCHYMSAVYTVPAGYAANPTVQCPAGYSIQNCMLHTPWRQDNPKSSVRVFKNGCEVLDCSNCKVNALCMKNNW